MDPTSIAGSRVLKRLPEFMTNLQEHNCLEDFLTFVELVVYHRYPLDCIAFRCFLDTVRWYSVSSTSQIVYREETKRFWRMVYKLFHGGALRFFSGLHSIEQDKETGEKGSPHNSNINFAVPHVQNLAADTQNIIPKALPPGIIQDSLDLRENNEVSMVLSVDGKKVALGLNNEWGDQDLMGYEVPNLQDTRTRFEKEKNLLASLHDLRRMEIGDATDRISECVSSITQRIRELRELKVRQTFHLDRLIKKAGTNWKESFLLHGISRTKAFLHELGECARSLLSVNLDLLNVGARYQGRTLTLDDKCLLDLSPYYVGLSDPETSAAYESHEPRLVKQRSDQWHALRKQHKLTGSTMHAALGLDGPKKQKEHILTHIRGEPKAPVSAEMQERLDHGTKNERNAVATLVNIVMPHYYPTLSFFEEGCRIIEKSNSGMILVSPDGSLCSNTDAVSWKMKGATSKDAHSLPLSFMAIEIKCPFPGRYKCPVQYSLPYYYVTQVLSEMASMDVKFLLFCSWSTESMAVHLVEHDPVLWDDLLTEAHNIYGQSSIPLPTKMSSTAKDLLVRIKAFAETNSSLLCEVPAQEVGRCDKHDILEDIENITMRAVASLQTCNTLCRRKATEILVWLLSDVDRTWKAEVPHSLPVCYVMKGYSLPVKVMRRMCDDVLDACRSRNIHVACTTFDGAYLNLATRDCEDQPLTLIQLAVSLWREVCKLSREELINILATVVLEASIDRSCNIIYSAEMQWLHEYLRLPHTPTAQPRTEGDHMDVLPESLQDVETLPSEALEAIDSELEETSRVLSTFECDEQDECNNTEDTHSDQGLHGDEVLRILHALQSHKESKVANTWTDKSVSDVREVIRSSHTLNKLRVPELNTLIQETKDRQRKIGCEIKMTGLLKHEKVNALSKLLGDGSTCVITRIVDRVYDLKTLAANALGKKTCPPSREFLCIVCAKLLYPHEREVWTSKSTVGDVSLILSNGKSWKPSFWFSYPEYSVKRQQLEPKCLDSHHLFVNCRVKVCKDGLPGFGISKKAWHRVSEIYPHVISKCLVVDLLDKQSNSYAQRTFGEEVEEKLTELGFFKEAHFCHLVRNWYAAEDEAGISAAERVEARVAFRNFLIDSVDFSTFPPFGMYVRGMPRQMYEGFLQNIDTHLQLYGVVKGGAYNARSVSSLANETFFGEMAELEPTKLGCPKSTHCPRLVSTVTEIMHYRNNPQDR